MNLTNGRWASKLLPFLPSLLLGLLGGIWLLLDPVEMTRRTGLLVILLAGSATAGLLLLGSLLLERSSASYKHGSKKLERALRRIRLAPWHALVLAGLTAVGEELLFRGLIMQYLGVWLQALLFGALHPVDRRAWVYTAYTAFAGVLLGYSLLLTGSLWTPIVAHFLVNLHGLLSVRGRRGRAGQSGVPTRNA